MAALDGEIERVKPQSVMHQKIGRRSKSVEPSARRSRRRSVERTKASKNGSQGKAYGATHKRRSKSASPKLHGRKRIENRHQSHQLQKSPQIDSLEDMDHSAMRNKRRQRRRASTGSSRGSFGQEVQSENRVVEHSVKNVKFNNGRRRRRASTGSADGTDMMKEIESENKTSSRRKEKILRRASTGSFDSSEDDLRTVMPSRTSREKQSTPKSGRQRRASTGMAFTSARSASKSPSSRRKTSTEKSEVRRSRSRSRTRENKQSAKKRHDSKSRSRSRSRAKDLSCERSPQKSSRSESPHHTDRSFRNAMVDPPRSPRPSRNPRLRSNRYLFGGVPRSRRASLGCSYEAVGRVEAEICYPKRHSNSHHSKGRSVSSSKEKNNSHRASRSLGNYGPDDFSQISLSRGKTNGPVVGIPVLIQKGLEISFSKSKAARLLLSARKREALCKPAAIFWSRNPRAINRCMKTLQKRHQRKAVPLIQRWYRGCKARLVSSRMMDAVELLFANRSLTPRNRRRFIAMAMSVVTTIQRSWRGFWVRCQVYRKKAKGRAVRFVRFPASTRPQKPFDRKTIFVKTETNDNRGPRTSWRGGDEIEQAFCDEDEASDIESGMSSLASNNTNQSPRSYNYSSSLFPASPDLSRSIVDDSLADKLAAFINPITLSPDKDKRFWLNEIQSRTNPTTSFVAAKR